MLSRWFDNSGADPLGLIGKTRSCDTQSLGLPHGVSPPAFEPDGLYLWERRGEFGADVIRQLRILLKHGASRVRHVLG